MRKKIAFLILAVLMMNGEITSIYAEEEIPEYTMDMLEEVAYDGNWISFEEYWDLYFPSAWDVLELTEEEEEAGILLYAKDPVDSGLSMAISFTDVSGEVEDLRDLAAQLNDAGYHAIETMYINEIPVVRYETDSVYGLSFINEEDIMYTIVVGQKNFEGDGEIANTMFLSLSLSETFTLAH